jgi:predicted dehydrogenase
MIRVGVIGYGYWGPNLVRNFSEGQKTELVAVSDVRVDRLSLAQRRCPWIYVTQHYREVLSDPAIQAVAIATPVSSHFDLVLQTLQAGKHVLVAKPMAASSKEALRLIEEAEKRNLTLMVDHTFVYTGAVRKIWELTNGGKLGEIYYYDSTRVNLGLFQHDVDVIWDLAVHDLSIMDYVLARPPCAVTATGMNHVSGGTENIAYLTLFFEEHLIAHINVNWLSPVKIRRSFIGGSKQMIVYDDMEPSEKIKVYNKGITVNGNPEAVYKMLISYRSGDMWAPQLDLTEGLQTEIQHFAECIERGQRPITDGHAGLRVVRILEAATSSMKQRGRLVELPSVEERRLSMAAESVA